MGPRRMAWRCAAAGALLFLAVHGGRAAPGTAPADRRIALTARDLDTLRAAAPPGGGGPSALDELVAAFVDEEILYREAVARGLGEDDAVVQRRLAQLGSLALPDGDDAARRRTARALGLERRDPIVRRRLVARMRAAFEAEGDATAPVDVGPVASAPRLRLTQVFLDPRRHGAALDDAARALRRTLDGSPPPTGVPLGDPLPLPATPPPLSQREMAAMFGIEFAAAVADLPAGRWSAPLPSAYGLHLVYVHAREPAAAVPDDIAAAATAASQRAARRHQALRTALAQRRARYEVVLP